MKAILLGQLQLSELGQRSLFTSIGCWSHCCSQTRARFGHTMRTVVRNLGALSPRPMPPVFHLRLDSPRSDGYPLGHFPTLVGHHDWATLRGHLRRRWPPPQPTTRSQLHAHTRTARSARSLSSLGHIACTASGQLNPGFLSWVIFGWVIFMQRAHTQGQIQGHEGSLLDNPILGHLFVSFNPFGSSKLALRNYNFQDT